MSMHCASLEMPPHQDTKVSWESEPLFHESRKTSETAFCREGRGVSPAGTWAHGAAARAHLVVLQYVFDDCWRQAHEGLIARDEVHAKCGERHVPRDRLARTPPAGGGPRQQHLLRPLSLWRGALCSDGTASHVGPHRDLLPNRPKRFGRTGWRCGRGAVVARGAAKRIAGDRKKQTARLTLATGPHSAERRRKAVAPRCEGCGQTSTICS